MSFPVEVSDAAADKAYNLLVREGREDLRLRIGVQPGGCAGLRTIITFDNSILEGDVIEDFRGIEVIIDKMSVPYLTGAKLDYEDTLQKSGFTLDNPNAASSCACGDSFS